MNILRNIIQRSLFVYLILAIILSSAVEEKRIAANYLSITKEFAEYVDKYSIYQDSLQPEKFEKAIKYYQALIQYLPSPALVYSNLGFCYYYLKDMGKAVESYQKAVTLEPKLYSIYYDLGLIAMVMKDYSLAVDLFQKSLKIIPEEKEDFIPIIQVSKMRGLNTVLDHMDRPFLRAMYDREQIYLHLSALFLETKDFQNMKQISLEGIEKFPGNVEFYYNVGVANYRLKDYRSAVYFLTAALEMASNFAEAHYYRALCWKEIGKAANYMADMMKTKEISQNGWKREVPNFRELHVYPESGIFFKAYSLETRDYSRK